MGSSYTKTGPFINGSAPGITAEFLNAVETYLVDEVIEKTDDTVTGKLTFTKTAIAIDVASADPRIRFQDTDSTHWYDIRCTSDDFRIYLDDTTRLGFFDFSLDSWRWDKDHVPISSGTIALGSSSLPWGFSYINRIRLNADPTADLDAATKQYVDAAKTEAMALGMLMSFVNNNDRE